jgi:hypothetical protein
MSLGILEKCFVFDKIANKGTKISIEKNSNPILKELSDIKEFDDRIKFAKKRWKLLGAGSSRTAFQINKKLIIKIAHNEKGVEQNKNEMNPKAQVSCTNKVVMADAEGKWVIMRNTDPLSVEEFKKIVGVGFKQFMNAIFYKFNNESRNWDEPRDYTEIEKNKLFIEVAELIFNNDLQIGDLDKKNAWRLLDGRPVIVDWGLTRSTFDTFYDKEDSSSSSSVKTSEK